MLLAVIEATERPDSMRLLEWITTLLMLLAVVGFFGLGIASHFTTRARTPGCLARAVMLAHRCIGIPVAGFAACAAVYLPRTGRICQIDTPGL